MTTATDTVQQEHELLVRCISDAYEDLPLLPGLDANGPALVWLAEHLLEARHQPPRHRLTRSGFLATGLRLPSVAREARVHRDRVREIAEFIGLEKELEQPAGALPYGMQKLVELGRALCMEPQVLLLDEPVAGMTADERRRVAAVVAGVRDSLGISIVLVEHDMGVVMRLADAVTVLDFGRRIAGGTPDEVQNDPAVVQAYLGAQE